MCEGQLKDSHNLSAWAWARFTRSNLRTQRKVQVRRVASSHGVGAPCPCPPAPPVAGAADAVTVQPCSPPQPYWTLDVRGEGERRQVLPAQHARHHLIRLLFSLEYFIDTRVDNYANPSPACGSTTWWQQLRQLRTMPLDRLRQVLPLVSTR